MSAWARFKQWLASDAWSQWILRDPRYWPSAGGFGTKTVSHEVVSEETALTYSAVWCATQLFCGIGGSLPLPIYRGLEDEDRQKARQHPLYRLLNVSPNPEQTAFAFRSIMWQWQVNWGNAYAEIERLGNDPGGEIVALWPVAPDRVRIKRDETGALYYEVRNDDTHEWIDVDAWRMWHLPSILTVDGIYGRGVIQHARETIGVGIAGVKKMAHGFGGGNLPRVVIKNPGKWDDIQRAAFRKEWHEIHDSPTGENVAVLGGGADFGTIGFSNVDSQFLELFGGGVEEIGRWYNLPPHMLKRLVNSTYNNIELLGAEFIKYTAIPWLRVWEQSIALDLLTETERGEYFAEHNVDAFMRGDSQARANFYHQGINDGWLNRNEARKFENLPPVDGGDTFLVQGAMVPLDDDGKPASEFTGNAPGAPTAEPVPSDSQALSSVRVTANRLLKSRLQWALTKETKEAAKQAKDTNGFCKRIEAFYGSQAVSVASEIGDTVALFGDCGIEVDANAIVSKWTSSGKELLVKAATGGGELSASVGFLLQSERWQSRPDRIIQEIAA